MYIQVQARVACTTHTHADHSHLLQHNYLTHPHHSHTVRQSAICRKLGHRLHAKGKRCTEQEVSEAYAFSICMQSTLSASAVLLQSLSISSPPIIIPSFVCTASRGHSYFFTCTYVHVFICHNSYLLWGTPTDADWTMHTSREFFGMFICMYVCTYIHV